MRKPNRNEDGAAPTKPARGSMRKLPNQDRSFRRLLGYAPVFVFHSLSRLLPARIRGAVWAALGKRLVWWGKPLRQRVLDNLALVMPEMPLKEREQLTRRIGANAARTLSEILFNRQFQKRAEEFSFSGPGLEVLRQAKGKGAIVVSGHFGQWEAIRAVLKQQGMETGAIYRPNNNGYYDALFLKNIKCGGEPIFPGNSRGMARLVRSLKSGKFVSVLLDQKFGPGEALDFLGHPASTSINMANVALKYGVPMVPAYGIRGSDPNQIEVVFEKAIEPTTAIEMTQEANNSLAARVRAAPEQWYWLHRRWFFHSK